MQGININLSSIVNVNVRQHFTDSSKLAIKCANPVGAMLLCEMIGVVNTDNWRGSRYFITAVDAKDFTAKLGAKLSSLVLEGVPQSLQAAGEGALALFNACVSGEEITPEQEEKIMAAMQGMPTLDTFVKAEKPKLKLVQLTSGESAQALGSQVIAVLDKCPECGTKDNMHWGFCPHNQH